MKQAVEAQKIARGWKCWIYKAVRVAKTKALISFAFVFAYEKCWFSIDVAHISEKTLQPNALLCCIFRCAIFVMADGSFFVKNACIMHSHIIDSLKATFDRFDRSSLLI